MADALTGSGLASYEVPVGVFAARRREFMSRAGGGAAIFLAAPETIRNNDVHHPYRQDSDFWYLTGFSEPEAVLVLRPGRDPDAVVFARPRDRAREIWNGMRLGPEGVRSSLGFPAAHAIEALGDELPRLVEGFERVWFFLGRDAAFDKRVIALIDQYRHHKWRGTVGPTGILDPAPLIHEMRLVKQPEEIECLRRAGRVSAAAHRVAMQVGRPGVYEHEIDAAVGWVCRRHGSARPGYQSIVGAGPHATILHYVENNARVGPQDLVLVDAGCEVGGYTADITRTWPAGGRFTAAQRALYEIVLEAQLAAIDVCRVGHPFTDVHETAVRVLVTGLVRIGLLTGAVDAIIKDNAYTRFYMHRTSHWLGLDVHDVGRYASDGVSRVLAAGNVLTVEPGLYVAADDAEAPPQYRGIGIRIEDDVLVTDAGPEVLTADVPKDVAGVEALCRTPLAFPDVTV